ncbi:MAG: MATE family efflux transporter [Phycisphaerales bacterium]
MAPRSSDIPIPDSGPAEPMTAQAHVETNGSVGATAAPSGVVLADDRLTSGRLAGSTMRRAVWVLSWPVLLEMLLHAGVNMVDATLAAGVSVAAADAIGASGYILWATAMIAIALGVGATAMISRAIGRKRPAFANAVLGQTTLLAWSGGLVTAGLFWLLAPACAGMMNLEGDAFDNAVTYLRICALGVPAMTFIEGAVCSIRGGGDSMTPMLVMLGVNIVNAFFTFMLSGVEWAASRLDDATGELQRHLILSNPFGMDMGVAGIAWGTTIAWWTGAVVLTLILARPPMRSGEHLRLTRRRLRPHWHTIKRIVRVGLPNFLESAGMWFGNFLTILMVGWMAHPGYLGAHIIAVRVEAFSYMPGFAISLAAATLTGQYLGMGRPDLAEKAIFRCTTLAVAFMTLMGVVFVAFPEAVVGVLTQQPEHLKITPILLMVTGFVQAPFAVAIVLRSALRGAGDTKAAMWITWITTYGIRLPLAWLCCGVDIPLPQWAGGGSIPNPAPLEPLGVSPLVGFWIGLCSEIVLRGVLFTVVVLRGRWKTARV